MSVDQAMSWAASVSRIAVIGAGIMGEGIAQSFAETGIEVLLLDISADAIARSCRQIEANLELAAAAGMGGTPPNEVLSRIQAAVATQPAQAISGCPFVLETIPEIATLKQKLFTGFDGLPEDVILASNTSSMTMSAICSGMRTGHRAVGVHYFNPAHIIPGVELHRGADTSDDSIAKARALIARCGKVPFLVKKEIPGFAINRLTAALMREIGHLLDEDVISARDLDAGVKATLGFRMAWVGPMEGSDFTGLDTGARVQTALLPTLSNRAGPFQQLLDNVAAGRLGLKSGSGWYSYEEGARERLLRERDARLLRQLRMFKEAEGK